MARDACLVLGGLHRQQPDLEVPIGVTHPDALSSPDGDDCEWRISDPHHLRLPAHSFAPFSPFQPVVLCFPCLLPFPRRLCLPPSADPRASRPVSSLSLQLPLSAHDLEILSNGQHPRSKSRAEPWKALVLVSLLLRARDREEPVTAHNHSVRVIPEGSRCLGA